VVTAMKQVARKSTAKIPQKLSAGGHQPNGVVPIRESPSQQIPANATSGTSSSSTPSLETEHQDVLVTDSSNQHKSVHLANGIPDSCKQALGNGAGVAMPTTKSISTAAATTVRQQTAERSSCTVTSACNLPVSTANVQLPMTLQSSSNIENWKSLPVKCAEAEAAKPSSYAASLADLSDPDDVIIVKADVDSKPYLASTKRFLSPSDEKNCEVKKARLDGAVGHLVQVDGSDRLSRKV